MDLAEKVDALPTEPGVYLFKSARGKVLYVGKAQNLRSRVRSYLTPGGDGRLQVPRLVAQTRDVEVLVLPTVKDALLLENELIKQHKPTFNVRLRDDKQYLVLRLDPEEEWPRLTMVRRFGNDGARYFGPYTSSQSMRGSLSSLRRIFPLRSCTDGTFRDYARRGRPCIEYEMKRCPGPCCGLVDREGYLERVHGTELFLRGRSRELVDELRARMEVAANAEAFEEAARLRDQIAAVERTVERQQIVSENPVSRDVFGWARRGADVEIQALQVRDGRMVGSSGYAFDDVGLGDADVLDSFLGQYYASGDADDVPGEVLCDSPFDADGALGALLSERAGRNVKLRVPQRGGARDLVKLATSNAESSLARRLEARESVLATLAEVQEALKLGALPRRIECYDVSTLAGTLAVASRVVFEDGLPRKADYRRYRVREAEAGDDYGCLREVVGRRLDRAETEPLPDLLLVDGGKGQLAVVSAALRDRDLTVDHAGIAKERDADSPSVRVRRSGGLKAERLFLPERKDAVLLPPDSRGLLLLQRVRDEAHRFAIEYQRDLRRRVGLTSILEEVPGIGPRKRRVLLSRLGSLKNVREASEAALAELPGISGADARALKQFFAALDSAGSALESDGTSVPTEEPAADAAGAEPPGKPGAPS